MPANGAGVWERTPGTLIANQGALVSAQVNNETNNLIDGINAKLSLSGQLPMTGPLAMGTQKITGLAVGTALTDSPTLGQLQSGIVSHSTAVAGTVDAIQVTMTPAITTWATNELISWKSGGVNTITAPTISKDAGSTTKIIKKGASAALVAGDTGASGYECFGRYNGTDLILLNPATAVTAADITNKPESFLIALSDEVTAITTGNAKVTFRMPYAFTLTSVKASLTTASSSGLPTVDINEAGSTILSTKITIDASELTSATAATAPVISDASLAADAEITFDIDVAGTGAKGLKCYLIGHQ